MKNFIINLLKFVLFAGVGVVILYFFYQNQNKAFEEQCRLDGKTLADCGTLLDKLVADFRGLNFFWVGCTLLAFTFSNYSRAVRWRMLIEPLGYRVKLRNAFFAVNITYFTNLWMSRAGELVRAASVARYEGISTSRVMGTVVVDRLLDMVSLIIIVGAAFLLQYSTLTEYLSANMKSSDSALGIFGNPIVQVILGIITLISLLLWLFRNQIKQTIVYQKAREIAVKMSEGLRTIRKVRSPFWFVFHSANIWVMYFMMTYLCFSAFAPTAHLGLMAALTVFVFGTFGIVIPSPGGMGTYHVLASAALVIYGVNSSDAFSFANIMFFAIQIFYSIVVGLISIILMRWINKDRKAEMEADEARVS